MVTTWAATYAVAGLFVSAAESERQSFIHGADLSFWWGGRRKSLAAGGGGGLQEWRTDEAVTKPAKGRRRAGQGQGLLQPVLRRPQAGST